MKYRLSALNIKETNGSGDRDKAIDFVKGSGIVLMVMGHTEGPLTDFIYLFHMAIFFIASGWLMNLKYARNLSYMRVYIKKKLKGLWIPYVGFNIVYLILNNLFIRLNIYTNNPGFLKEKSFIIPEFGDLFQCMGFVETAKQILKVILFKGGTQMGSALWFFNTLFFVLVLYMAVQYILCRFVNESRADVIQIIVAIIFVSIGHSCQLHDFRAFGMGRVLSYYCLIYLGHIFNKHTVFRRLYSHIKPAIAFAVSCIFLLLLYHRGIISLSNNTYPNPLFLIAASVAGWTMLYSLGMMLQKAKIITDALQYISVHSVPIVGMHFLCFKIVNLIAVLALGMKMYMIAAFPVLELPGAWWLLYTVVGISIPLSADRVWIMVRRLILARLDIPVSGHHHSAE